MNSQKHVALSMLRGISKGEVTEPQQFVLANACNWLEGATLALVVFSSLIAYVFASLRGNLSYSILKDQCLKLPLRTEKLPDEALVSLSAHIHFRKIIS